MNPGRRTRSEKRHVEPFPLVVGLLFCGFAGGALLAAFGNVENIDPVVRNMALPVFLVALGISGLLLYRRN